MSARESARPAAHGAGRVDGGVAPVGATVRVTVPASTGNVGPGFLSLIHI